MIPRTKKPHPSFKSYAIYQANGVVGWWPGHGQPTGDAVFRQKTRLFRTFEEARMWVVQQALAGRRVEGVLYERPTVGRLSHGEILERFNGGRGWWEIDRG